MKHFLLLVLFSLEALPGFSQRSGGVITNSAGNGQPPVEQPYFCVEAISGQQHAAGWRDAPVFPRYIPPALAGPPRRVFTPLPFYPLPA